LPRLDINNDGPEDVFMVLPERKLAKFYPTVQRKFVENHKCSFEQDADFEDDAVWM
jgi:hypothetical protein